MYFEERQRFRQLWLWTLILASTIIALILTLYDGVKMQELLILLIFPPILLLFYIAELRTEVRDNGVYFRFYPLHRNPKHVSFDDLNGWDLENYNPVRDYGGWGIRKSAGEGKAYTVSGWTGVRLTRSHNQSIIIGSQRPAEFTNAIEKALEHPVTHH